MASEYRRIQRRVLEDPGTAGDQGEENWAEFLRGWLPANYPVVTKGRILGIRGKASPQVDILVLHPSYPVNLRDKKLYFAGGVVAAFECKLTLKKEHIRKAFENAVIIKQMLHKRLGNPYDELHQPPLFGLLAHSHVWKKSHDNADQKIHDIIFAYEDAFCSHPREMLDLICVADLGMYILKKAVWVGPHVTKQKIETFGAVDVEDGIETGFWGCQENPESGYDSRGDILGTLIFELTSMLAYEDQSLQAFTDYLAGIGIYGGVGRPFFWDRSVLSDAVRLRLNKVGYEKAGVWSKWAPYF